MFPKEKVAISKRKGSSFNESFCRGRKCEFSGGVVYLGGGNSNIFYFHPETWGRFSPILTSIFFKWVETTNQNRNLFESFEFHIYCP